MQAWKRDFRLEYNLRLATDETDHSQTRVGLIAGPHVFGACIGFTARPARLKLIVDRPFEDYSLCGYSRCDSTSQGFYVPTFGSGFHSGSSHRHHIYFGSNRNCRHWREFGQPGILRPNRTQKRQLRFISSIKKLFYPSEHDSYVDHSRTRDFSRLGSAKRGFRD